MKSYMVCKLAAFGATNKWVPMSYTSGSRRTVEALLDLERFEPRVTHVVFERVQGQVFQMADHDNVLEEIQAWRMLSPEEKLDLVESQK